MGARSPLLAEPPLSDQTLIDHFGSLRDSADWWVALKLTGADATQENAKTVCRRLLLRLHPDKCKLPAAAEAFRKLNHFRDKIAKRPYSMSAPAHGSGIRPVPAKPPRTATATAPGRGRSTAKPPTAAPPKAAPAQPKPAPPKPAPAPPKPALRKPAPPLPAPPKPPSAPPKPPSAPAAAASDADKAECKACTKGWKRPHTCGKIRGKPGPKPRHREGCQGCLGLHMAHTCGLRGRPEARQPHVWSTRPSPEIPPEIPHVRAQTIRPRWRRRGRWISHHLLRGRRRHRRHRRKRGRLLPSPPDRWGMRGHAPRCAAPPPLSRRPTAAALPHCLS